MSKIVVGISGATGVIYGIRMLKALCECGTETHLVITQSAVKNMHIETPFTMADLEPFASTIYDVDDVGGGHSERLVQGRRHWSSRRAPLRPCPPLRTLLTITS